MGEGIGRVARPARVAVAVLVCGLAGPASASAAGRTFYVAPGGGDDNRGTAAAPFATVARAQQAVRAATSGMRADIVVYLRGGTFTLATPWALDWRDSGRNGYRVIWRAYPGETPVISGGVQVRGFVPGSNGEWSARVGFLQATRQLYVNGVRAIRARGGPLPGAAMTPFGYRTTDTGMQRWRNPRDLEFVYDLLWKQIRGGVAAISGTDIHMKQPWWANAQLWFAGLEIHGCCGVRLPTSIENAHELLDQPGEWYLDRSRGILYYRPRRGERMRTAKVVAPVLERIVEGRGTLVRPLHDVSFEGLTFAYATWLLPSGREGLAELQANFALTGLNTSFDAIDERLAKMPAGVSFRAAQRVELRGDRFLHLGAAGLGFEYGSRDNAVVGNELADISGNAVQLGDVFDHHPDDAREVVQGNLVADNYIHDVAVEYQGGVGIWAGYVARTTIEHNELANLPYTAISLGWGWGRRDYPGNPTAALDNRISDNSIHDYMQVLIDGGGIYVLGAQPGLVIDGNVIANQAHPGGGIYLDDGSRYVTVRGNLVYRANSWSFVFKGSDETIRDNYWDSESAYGWSWFGGGTVADNHPIAGPGEAPAALREGAGLEPGYRHLLARSR